MYWCCGKIKEDAPGCVRSKHELKDENEEEALNPEEKKTYKKCSSCKDVGHPAHQCPRDPNTRSNVDVTTEIDRISLVKKQRTKIGPKSHEKSKRLVSLLSPKNGGSDIIELSNRTQMEFNDIEEIRDEAVNTTIDITSIAKAGLTEKSLSRRSVKRRTIKEMRESHFIDESISELFVASKNNIMTSGSPLELN